MIGPEEAWDRLQRAAVAAENAINQPSGGPSMTVAESNMAILVVGICILIGIVVLILRQAPTATRAKLPWATPVFPKCGVCNSSLRPGVTKCPVCGHIV
jgi:hypothetical protein